MSYNPLIPHWGSPSGGGGVQCQVRGGFRGEAPGRKGTHLASLRLGGTPERYAGATSLTGAPNSGLFSVLNKMTVKYTRLKEELLDAFRQPQISDNNGIGHISDGG